MTSEQEQLIRQIVTQLQPDNFPVDFSDWLAGYHCPLCGGDAVEREKDFKHAPDCLLTLAERLRETLIEQQN